MSMIMPAGNKKLDWVAGLEKLTKTAGVETDGVEERDDLFEAAKGVVDRCNVCDREVEVKDEAPMAEVDSVEVSEVVDPVEETEAPIEVSEVEIDIPEEECCVDDAVEKIEVAIEGLEEAKEAIQEVSKTEEVEEVEIEIEDDSDIDSEKIDIPGVVEETEETEDEIVEGKDCTASAEEFCKFAKISPKNRQKLADYWKNALGYPSDYVDLLVKDYEK